VVEPDARMVIDESKSNGSNLSPEVMPQLCDDQELVSFEIASYGTAHALTRTGTWSSRSSAALEKNCG